MNKVTFGRLNTTGTGVRVVGMTYDRNANKLYGATNTQLYSINKTTGVFTLIGSFDSNHDDVEALAYDPIADILYGVDAGIDLGEVAALIRIDPGTGSSTLVRQSLRRSRCDKPSDPKPCSQVRAAVFAD